MTDLIQRLRPLLLFLAAIWVIELVNQIAGHRLNNAFGLEPRRFVGLIGIPAMPFLHGGISHIVSNTLPLAILGAIGLMVAPRRFAAASVVIVIVSGLAVWLLARSGIVVGASGLIFGWFGFLVTLGILERSPRAIAGAVAVVLIYGGMVWGVLPQEDMRVSWEAHLFGALAGGATAWLFKLRERRKA
ncbi:MAG: rhomboid family intramembrane serine protease [Pseudomonadota bacterium]